MTATGLSWRMLATVFIGETPKHEDTQADHAIEHTGETIYQTLGELDT